MGRTNPTYRNWLDGFEQDLAPYRRSLRQEHQEDFDRIFDRATEHSSAAAMQNFSDPTIGTLISILISQEREIRKLKG